MAFMTATSVSSSILGLRALAFLTLTIVQIASSALAVFDGEALVISYSNQLEIVFPSPLNSTIITLPALKTIVAVSAAGASTLFLTNLQKTSVGASVHLVDLENPRNATEILHETSLPLVQDIAVDSVGGFVFLADSKARKLVRYTMGSDNGQVLTDETTMVQFQATGDRPKALAFDRCHKWLYFTRWNRDNSSIDRVSSDGSTREVFIAKNLVQPRSLTIDPWERNLFWIDVDDKRDEFRIEKVGLDGGSTARSILCRGKGISVFDMAVNRDAVFWSDGRNMAVWRVDRNGEESVCKQTVVKKTSSARPMGLAVVGQLPAGCGYDLVTPPQEAEMAYSSAIKTSRVEPPEEMAYVSSGSSRLMPVMDQSSTPVLAFCLAAAALLLLACASSIFVLVYLKLCRPPKQRKEGVTVVRKGNSRTFSRTIEDEEGCIKNSKSPFSTSCSGNAEGIVFDLEDCCHMVICDKPCVEYKARKPTHRKKPRADKDVEHERLLENDALSVDRELDSSAVVASSRE